MTKPRPMTIEELRAMQHFAITCDECHCTTTGPADDHTLFLTKVKKAGWTLSGPATLCPECTAK